MQEGIANINKELDAIEEAYNEFLKYVTGKDYDRDKIEYKRPSLISLKDITNVISELKDDFSQFKLFFNAAYHEGVVMNYRRFKELSDFILDRIYEDDMHVALDDEMFDILQHKYVKQLKRLNDYLQFQAYLFVINSSPTKTRSSFGLNNDGELVERIQLDDNNLRELWDAGSTPYLKLSSSDELIIAKFPIATNKAPKHIVINVPIIAELKDGLALYFPKQEAPLRFLFHGSAVQLVEVFRRLRYNGMITNTATEVRDWLCFYFKNIDKQDKRAKPLKSDTVYDYLTKERGDIRQSSKRICNFDWLPYFAHQKLQKIKNTEKL
jgi:hypothetical protein